MATTCHCCDDPITPKNRYGYCSRTPECRARYQRASQRATSDARKHNRAFYQLMREILDEEKALAERLERERIYQLVIAREIQRTGYVPTPGPPDRWFS